MIELNFGTKPEVKRKAFIWLILLGNSFLRKTV